MNHQSRPSLALLTILGLAPVLATPTLAHAGEWVPLGSTNIDTFANTGRHPEIELVVATEEVPTPTKVQGVVWIDSTKLQINYAQREAPVGSPLFAASWSSSIVTSGVVAAGPRSRPYLAMDPATGTPYILHVDQNLDVWLSTYVGPFQGTCGTSNSWQCENLTEICGLPEVEETSPLLELGGDFGRQADTVHIIDLEPGFMHIHKDLETETWTCHDVPSTSAPYLSEPYRAASMVIRHELDDRVKPQTIYLGHKGGTEAGPLQVLFRSLLNYAGTPLPPWSWTEEYAMGLTGDGVSYTFPALALLDDGLSEPTPTRTGYGLPGLAYLLLEQVDTNGSDDACTAPEGETSWPLLYQKAYEPSGSLWYVAEIVVDGEPCHPSLDAGWDTDPYLVFADQTEGTIALTTRRPATGWEEPQTVALSGTYPSIAYDEDDGTIAIAYYDTANANLVVADGVWSD